MKIRNSLVVYSVLASILFLFAGSTKTYSQTLGATSRRVVFEQNAFSGTSVPLPTWVNGRLVTHEIETYEEGQQNVRWYDRDGKQEGSAAIWFPGTQRLLIYSAVASPDGRIVIGGKSERSDGANAPFVARLDTTGQISDVIQTSGFYPTNVCVAPDGTVWSFGGIGHAATTDPNSDILRHFDFQKGQIASYLPRSRFPGRPSPDSLAGMICGPSSLSVVSTGAGSFVTLGYSDSAPQIYTCTFPDGLRLTGYAAVADKFYGAGSKAGWGGLYYLALNGNTKTAEWMPMSGTVGLLTDPPTVTALWGADSSELVVSRSGDSVGSAALHWAAPER